MTTTRDALAELDARDPLARHRDQFELPRGVIYLDGNSLGALPKSAQQRVSHTLTYEWGHDLIRSWNNAGWIDLPRRIGDKISLLIGANQGEVIVADSTSVNVFKVLSAALKLNRGRTTIVSERDNFPTDLYIAQGLIDMLGGGHTLRLVTADEVYGALDEDTAVLMLTHVNYRSGRMHDMAALTAKAHAKGALVIWDLAHSAGALPVDLNEAGADFAVGCGYKYLNGGPGAPAFVFVAERYQAEFSQPLSGWLGHAQPFAFDWKYVPADGIGRYLCGTPPVLSMIALDCGVDSVLQADMARLREKSLALSELFITLVGEQCGEHGLTLLTPRDPDQRGSQVSFSHPDAYAIMQALIARGVIGDFRAPDILRFGLAPLYLRHTDVWDAVAVLREVLDTRAWDDPEYSARKAVT